MYLLFDIGGTKTRIAASKNGKNFGEPRIFATSGDDFQEGMRHITHVAKELVRGVKIEAAVGGIAGPLDQKKSKLVGGRSLKAWVGKSLKAELEDMLSVPVFVENDADLVGLGEAHYGAGKGYNIVVYITVSTGVGGTRIVHGSIDESAMGFEPGKQIIDKGKTLEELVSGIDTAKRMGKEPYEIPQQDPLWEELAEWLAVGVHNTIVHWSPDVVVLGGSMITKRPGIAVEKVRVHLENTMKIFPKPPPIKQAVLQDVGGLYGALALAKQLKQ